MKKFILQRGSIRPPFETMLADVEGNPIDLTLAATPRLVVATKPETATGSLVLDIALTFVIPRTLGQLVHEWLSADTSALAEGTYVGQVIVSFGAELYKSPKFDFMILSDVEA